LLDFLVVKLFPVKNSSCPEKDGAGNTPEPEIRFIFLPVKLGLFGQAVPSLK
jgi:hypothetical protein